MKHSTFIKRLPDTELGKWMQQKGLRMLTPRVTDHVIERLHWRFPDLAKTSHPERQIRRLLLEVTLLDGTMNANRWLHKPSGVVLTTAVGGDRVYVTTCYRHEAATTIKEVTSCDS